MEPPGVDDDELEGAATVAPGGSLLDVLRAKRDEVATDDELKLYVKPYDDRVVLRCQFPEGGWERLRKIGRKAEGSRDPLSELYSFARSIAACTTEILGVGEDGTLSPIDPDPEGPPLRFTPRLAGLLGFAVPEEVQDPTVHIVRHFYSPQAERTGIYRGDVALTADAVRLAEFLESSSQDADRAFVGE